MFAAKANDEQEDNHYFIGNHNHFINNLMVCQIKFLLAQKRMSFFLLTDPLASWLACLSGGICCDGIFCRTKAVPWR